MDLILLSDLIYFSQSHAALLHTLLALSSPPTTVSATAFSPPIIVLSVKRRDSESELEFLQVLQTHFAIYQLALKRCGCRFDSPEHSTAFCDASAAAAPSASTATTAAATAAAPAPSTSATSASPALLHVSELDAHDPNLEVYVMWKRTYAPTAPSAAAPAPASASAPAPSTDAKSNPPATKAAAVSGVRPVDRAFVDSNWLLRVVERTTPLRDQLSTITDFDYFL